VCALPRTLISEHAMIVMNVLQNNVRTPEHAVKPTMMELILVLILVLFLSATKPVVVEVDVASSLIVLLMVLLAKFNLDVIVTPRNVTMVNVSLFLLSETHVKLPSATKVFAKDLITVLSPT